MITDALSGIYRRSKWYLVLRGLFGIAVGAFILLRPMDTVAVFALVIALWALVEGITNIVYAVELRSVASHWGMLLLSGIVSTIFGIAALFYYPVLSLSFAVLWVALWLLLGGAVGAYIVVLERRAGVPWGWTLAFSVLTIVAGVLSLMYPGLTLAGLMSVVAYFAILGGIVRLIAAWRLQSFEQRVDHIAHNPA